MARKFNETYRSLIYENVPKRKLRSVEDQGGYLKGELLMKLKKELISALKPKRKLMANGIVGQSEKMNRRIERNITITERKIAMGMKRAQSIQTK